jgi:hypothetical protein
MQVKTKCSQVQESCIDELTTLADPLALDAPASRQELFRPRFPDFWATTSLPHP